jgi:hypothetical protein
VRIFKKQESEFSKYRMSMLKEAAGIAGGALLLTPLGVPIFLYGVAGILVGGAGLIVADSLLKEVMSQMNISDLPKADGGVVKEVSSVSGQ